DASRLLAARESQKLRRTAPAEPRVYPFVCTYPGHWRRMYGAMYVVDGLDEYLADPTVYVAKNPLPIADDLLKFTRPRTEWKFDELASSVEKMEPRSFNNAKQIFTVANCVACHRVNGAGTEIGADLTKLDGKFLAREEILDLVAYIVSRGDAMHPLFRMEHKH